MDGWVIDVLMVGKIYGFNYRERSRMSKQGEKFEGVQIRVETNLISRTPAQVGFGL